MRLLVIVAALAACAASASAVTYLVRPDGTGDFPTIQAAISAASSGDIIELADGTFTGNGNRDIDFLGKAVTVRSQSGNPYACTIDCEGTLPTPHRGFILQSGETQASSVQGIRITNGDTSGASPNRGGAVLCTGNSAVTISNCVFVGNSSGEGGAISLWRSSAHVTGCHFVDNEAGGGGAAAVLEVSAACFTDCKFMSNYSSGYGGAIVSTTQSSLFGLDCSFLFNGSLLSGGAIALMYSTEASLVNCWLENNYSCTHGGAVYQGSAWPSIVSSIAHCTFIRNYADEYGGAIYWDECTLVISSCTLSQNLAGISAGGIRLQVHANAVIERTVIAFSLDGGALRPEGGATVVLSCCNIFGNVGGDWVGPIAEQLHTNGNFSADPCFCNLDHDDYHLWNYSPCAQVGCGTIGAWPVGCWAAQDVLDSDVTGLAGPGLLRVSASPNPFASTTSIRLSLPEPVGTRIGIFDAAGRGVRNLVSGGSASGSTTLIWDGRSDAGVPVPAGVYWVRAAQGHHDAASRVLVVR